jgi:hypothetical protein
LTRSLSSEISALIAPSGGKILIYYGYNYLLSGTVLMYFYPGAAYSARRMVIKIVFGAGSNKI